MPRPVLCSLLPLALFAFGCGSEPPAAASTHAPTVANDRPPDFQPGTCGKISGSVTWHRDSPIPVVPQVHDVRPRPDGSGSDTRSFAHSYSPRIDQFTPAVQGAVVYLRGVNPARAKPWDLSPVSVEIRDSQLVVKQTERPKRAGFAALREFLAKQNERPGRVGFVRRGEPVTFQSTEPIHHVLRGRGAAFFALPFPDPTKPLERRFDTYGRIELSSAAGYHWHAADLFVCDHPYYAVSDSDGMFAFTQVPEGTYELVVWHPNWTTTASERNPETGLVQRVVYAAPLESSHPVMALAGRMIMANPVLIPPKR